MPIIKKVAVANRGEIAKRVLSACQEMGLKSVLLYASGDTDNEAFRLSEERICIGPADPLQSYLDIDKNIKAALGAGASAIHPGYGFLSENPDFATQCENKGLIFIGPNPESLKTFGNKISARKKAEQASLPVLPVCSENSSQEKTVIQKAEEIGYPLMIKAACGGGGRGLKLIFNKEELRDQLPIIRSEILQSFNSKELFLEKYLDSAKHIELQIFVAADKEIFILGDRDCSSQRRHQKIIEEAPSQIPFKMKEKMKEAVRELLSLTNYQGAGTMEFLVQGENFYFLEMNTRLQVEHTVTEMIYGVDIVKAQILTAMGQPAFFNQKDLQPRGHSLQCRICAEDPQNNFLPSSGPLLSCRWPQEPFVRVDTACQTGDRISTFYDSLVAKLIVWEHSRVRAIEKMKKALEATILFGIDSNINFLHFLLSHPLFIENQITTKTLEHLHSLEWDQQDFPLPEELMKKVFDEWPSHPSAFSPSKPLFNPWSDFLKENR